MTEQIAPEKNNPEVGQIEKPTPSDNTPGELIRTEQSQDGEKTPADLLNPKEEAGPEDGEKGEKEGEEAAPEEYKITLPEGMQVDQPLLDRITPIAQKHGVAADVLQEIVSAYAEHVEENGKSFTEQAIDAANKINDEWAAAARKDPEYGGDKFTESIGVINAAFKAFDPENKLRSELSQAMMLNNPEILRLLYRVGMRISEDQTPRGGSGGAAQKSAAEILYGKK